MPSPRLAYHRISDDSLSIHSVKSVDEGIAEANSLIEDDDIDSAWVSNEWGSAVYRRDNDETALLVRDGQLILTRKWCTGHRKAYGFTRRNDGVWVRPCCMRPERSYYLRWGDNPVPSDYASNREKYDNPHFTE